MLCRTREANDQSGPSIREMQHMLGRAHCQDFYPGKGGQLFECSRCGTGQSEFWTLLNGKRLCCACLSAQPDKPL